MWIALTALLTRLLFFLETVHTDAATLLMGDARGYDAWAHRIASGDWLGSGVFYQAPLYPYLMGIVYALGGNVAAVKILQCVLGAAAAVLLALAGREFLSRRAGTAAGFLLALYPSAIFFDGTIQNTSLAIFLLSALLFLLARWSRGQSGADRLGAASTGSEDAGIPKPAPGLPRLRALFATGAVLGLLILTRENTLVFAPVIAIWIVLGKAPRRALLRRVGMFAGGLALVLLPVAARNMVAGGDFALTTAQFGPNLYIGNSARANGAYVPLVTGRGDVQFEREDAIALAESETGRKLTPGAVSSFWAGKALRWMAAHPGDWARLTARKIAFAFNAVEMSDTEDQYTYAEWSRVLRLLGWILHFGILLPAAAAGMVLSWPSRRRLAILYALAASYAATLIAFYVISRYRMPLVPFTILFASAFASLAAGRLIGPEKRSFPHLRATRGTFAVTAAAVLVAAIGSDRPIADRNYFRAVMHCNIAAGLLEDVGPPEAGDRVIAAGGQRSGNAAHDPVARATGHLREALRLQPEEANAHHLLGVALAAEGEPDAAEREYLLAASLAPDRALTWFKLGELRVSTGDLAGAAEAYERGLALDPRDAEGHNNLATVLARLGRFNEAMEQTREALAIRPDLPGARYNLGLMLAQTDRLTEAAGVFRSILSADPKAVAARQNLASVEIRLGRTGEAVRELEEVLRLDPSRNAVRARLAWILATCPEDRVRDGRRALELAGAAVSESGGDPRLFPVLAAAYAECGQWDAASEAAGRALSSGGRLAPVIGDQKRLDAQIAAYRAHRPWRADPREMF